MSGKGDRDRTTRDRLVSAAVIIGGLILLAALWAFGFWLDLKYMQFKLWLLGR